VIPAIAHRPAGAAESVVDGDCLRHPDGSVSAVVRTGELDIEALDASRRAHVLSVFTRLCHTMDTPLQIVVRLRALRPSEVLQRVGRASQADADVVTAVARDLDGAMRTFWSQRLTATPAYQREVLIAVRAPTRDRLTACTVRVRDSVRAMGIPAERLRDDALAAAAYAGLERPLGIGWSAHPQFVVIDGTYLRGFTLRRLPGHAVNAGWLTPLLRVGVECDIAIHLAPASLSEALTTLGRRLRDFSAHRLIEGERGVVADVHVDIGLDAAFELRTRLARNAGRPLHLSITAMVRAENLAQLRHAGETMRVAFQSALASSEAVHFRHPAAFMSTLPLGVDRLHTRKLVESSAAAVCFPWVDAGCADPDGYRLGATLRGEAPVTVAPFHAARHINANVAVLAASGHGKSFAMGALMLEAATHGVDCVVIDPEGEYERVVAALGGTYLSLAPGGGSAVNVLETGGAEEDAVAALVGLVCVLRDGNATDVERAAVDRAARDAITRARHEGRTALLHDCLPALESDAPAAAAVVRRYCTGALSQLFDRETSVRIGRGVTGISLRDTPAEHMAAATFIVASWLWRLVRDHPRRRHILFDEVGALCAHAPLRSLLVQLARRCRKSSASLVVATQNAQDLLGSAEGSVVLTNCAIAMLGGHRAAEAARMEQAFGLTDAQRRFIETAARGEFLLLAGDRRLTMRVEVPPEHLAILSR
jgi:hypothetical protein